MRKSFSDLFERYRSITFDNMEKDDDFLFEVPIEQLYNVCEEVLSNIDSISIKQLNEKLEFVQKYLIRYKITTNKEESKFMRLYFHGSSKDE